MSPSYADARAVTVAAWDRGPDAVLAAILDLLMRSDMHDGTAILAVLTQPGTDPIDAGT